MINHVRTLLLNKSPVSPSVELGGEFIDPTFKPLNLSTELKQIRQIFLPLNLTEYQENYIMAYLMRILHSPELEKYALMFDSRYTYDFSDNFFKSLKDQALQISGSSIPGFDLISTYNSSAYQNDVASKVKWEVSSQLVETDFWIPTDERETSAWYDASDTSTITQVGGLVSGWGDKSGNNYDLVQTQAAYQPKFLPKALNGQDTVYVDGDPQGTGVRNWLEYAIPNSGDAGPLGNRSELSGDFAIFAAGRTIKTVPGILFLHSSETAGDRLLTHVPWINNKIFFDVGNTQPPDRISTVDPVLFFGEDWTVNFFNSLTQNKKEIWKDGVKLAVSQTGSEIGTSIVLGTKFYVGGYTPTGNAQNMYVGEIVVFRGNLSDTARVKIEGYLAHKWGTTANLEDTHPYKNIPPLVDARTREDILPGTISTSNVSVKRSGLLDIGSEEVSFFGNRSSSIDLKEDLISVFFKSDTGAFPPQSPFKYNIAFFPPPVLDLSALLAKLIRVIDSVGINTLLNTGWKGYADQRTGLSDIWTQTKEQHIKLGAGLLAYALRCEQIRLDIPVLTRDSTLRRYNINTFEGNLVE